MQQTDDKNSNLPEIEGKIVNSNTGAAGGSAQEMFSQVAASPKNRTLAVVVFAIVMVGIVYYLLYAPASDPKKDKNKDVNKKIIPTAELSSSPSELVKKAEPVTQITDSTVQIPAQQPALPSLPAISAPQLPEAPPAPTPAQPPMPVFPQLSTSGGAQAPSAQPVKSASGIISVPHAGARSVADQEELKKKDARRKASSVVLGANNLTNSAGGGKPAGSNSEFLGFGTSSAGSGGAGVEFGPSTAAKVSATYMTSLDRTIAQGKLIHAVLETAINTDVLGMARAIISRDVYGESGREILVPKGSRVIGEYAKEKIKDGQTRISVNWTRLIRPDGIDIMLDSGGTDTLGRGGIEGSLDTKFWTRLSSAFLVSFVVPVIANEMSKAFPNSLGTNSGSGGQNATTTTTTTGAAGSSTTTQTSQFQEATKDFQDIAKDVIKKTFSAEPTIRVPQGERINIFVARDLIFPTQTQLQAIRAKQ